MELLNVYHSHTLSLHLHVNKEYVPPTNMIALFYFLKTIKIVQPFLRIELDVTPLQTLSESLQESYEWSTECQLCFENVVKQLGIVPENRRTVQVYP